MKIIVNAHKCEIDKTPVNEKEINITKCEFEFAEEITSEFVKEALFTLVGKSGTYKEIIVNNQCKIPSEVLEEKGTIEVGVVAKLVEGTTEIKRYNPSPAYFPTWQGSLKDAENSQPITPSEFDQYEQALQDGLTEVNQKLVDIDEAIEDVNEAITETNNLNLDVSKSGKVATVTLTKKDASTKAVTLSDGTSLMFNWDGTKLGIKTDEDAEYTYVDLQGIQGVPGPKGDAFQIKKTYTSVAEMNADFNNMQLGDYVMIATTVEVEDNAKLYTRGEEQWIFISDFSGATGIRGETGLTPNIQIGTVVSGETPNVTRTGTNENPVLNFTLVKGDKGDVGSTGPTGATGNGIASITKTSSEGLVDTYTITYTDGTTSTFNITNGEDGETPLSEFNALKERVEDLEDNQITLPAEGTNIHVEDAAKARLYEFGLSKESSQETITLPDEYTLVNYIESSGSQYIDILYNFTSEFAELKMNAQLTELSTTETAKALCGRSVSGVGRIFYLSQNSLYGFYWQTGDATINNIASNNADTNKHYFDCVVSDKNYFYIDNNLIGSSDKNSSILNESLVCVFARKGNNNVASNFSKMKLYDLKLYDNQVLVCDLIPCYRNSDNEVGLYDLVNNVFYTNKGTGAFTYGSTTSIPNPDYPVEVKTVKGYRNSFDESLITSKTVGSLTINNNGKINVTGTTTSNVNINYSFHFTNADVGKTITFMVVGKTDGIENIGFKRNGTGVGLTVDASSSWKITNVITQDMVDRVNQFMIYVKIYGESIDVDASFNVILVEGTQELPYVPYGNNYVNVAVNDGTNTNNYPIPLNNNEIVGIGDYKDELIVDKNGHVWLNKIMGKYTFTGQETGWDISTSGNNNLFYTDGKITDFSIINDITCICTHFIAQSNVASNNPAAANNYRVCFRRSESLNRIYFSDNDYTTANDFKNMLQQQYNNGTPIILYYVLRNPYLIDLNATVDLKLFKGVNNITNSEDGNMRIRYVESIDSIINDFDTRLKALEQGESL